TFERPQHFRGAALLSWSRGPWSTTTTVTYVPSYQDTTNSNLPGVTRRVAPYATANQRISYVFQVDKHSWLDRAKAALNIFNVFNKDPPASLSLSGYDATVANPRGRSIYIDLTKTF